MATAVVIGASMAGLLAAAALHDSVDEVVVLERAPRPGPNTSIAAQGRLPHLLLAGGADAVEVLIPGFRDEVRARGAIAVGPHQGCWWNGDYRAEPPDDGARTPFASRALVEALVRHQVEALPGVRVRYGARVRGLRGDAREVHGVDTADGPVAADLVVDAAGRGSDAVRWLAALGAPAPEVDEIRVDVTYLAAFPRRRPGTDFDRAFYVCQSQFPHHPRIGVVFAIEDDRWAIILGGYHGDRGAADAEGVQAFADSLAMPEIGALVRACGPITQPLVHRFPSNRRRRFERVRLPAGFLPLGDTMSSFNPVYGQGMSVAALEAVALQRAVRVSGPRPDTRRLVRRFGRIVDGPWTMAAGADLRHPLTPGHRPPSPTDRWVARVLDATTRDPRVSRTMLRVTGLQQAPATLLGPATVVRTLRATARDRRRSTTAETASATDAQPVEVGLLGGDRVA